VELAEQIEEYYLRVDDNSAAATVALMQVEHMYYKHDSVSRAVSASHTFKKQWGSHSLLHPACKGSQPATPDSNWEKSHPAAFLGSPAAGIDALAASTVDDRLEELIAFIFKEGDERAKTRALLCAVFYHSLHDRFYKARDMFLISHIQDSIDRADTKTQILHNRASVTMGLAAFRAGLIHKAHECLQNICTPRVKEMLAQGQSRAWYDKDPEREKMEKRRQMPYHMHINPDLLECCHLTSAMLLELPVMARPSSNYYSISKSFRKYLANYNRQVFTGPPESTREHVMAAAKSLVEGNWRKACDYILNLGVWDLIPAGGGAAVKTMLRTKIKEESLRIYLLTHGAHYASLSVSHLSLTFEMEISEVRRIVSAMLANKTINGAWDLSADVLVMYQVDPTHLQTMAVLVADKVGVLSESNERLIAPLSGGNYGKEEWLENRKQQWNNENRRGWRSSNNGGRYPARPGQQRSSGRGGDRRQGGGGGRGQGGGGGRGYGDGAGWERRSARAGTGNYARGGQAQWQG
jgi:translation initiation factor 3 subunit C